VTAPPVRIGLVGCGRIGRMHAGLIAGRVAGVELGAVFDVDDAAAAAVSAELGVRRAASAAEIIGGDDIDAAAICSSTDTHVELMEAAAAAGKPIFVEKPVSLDLAALDRAASACAEAGVAVQVGFNRRFDPSHRRVRDRVAAGDAGDVHLVRISSRDPAPPPVEYLKVSGGIFLDMTVHDFDMARFVTASEVVEVYAAGAVRVDEAIGAIGDIDTAVVTLTHACGAITVIDNSRRAAYGYDQRVEVFGSEGLVASQNPTADTAVLLTGAGWQGSALPHFFLERYLPSYEAEWSAFAATAAGAPSPVSMADGRAPLVIGLAAQRSLRENRPVPVEEIG